MNRVTIDLGGDVTQGEVLSLERLDAGRTLVRVRSDVLLERGRSCIMEADDGKKLECIVSNYTPVGPAYVIELRCLADASFFDRWPAPAEQAGADGGSGGSTKNP